MKDQEVVILKNRRINDKYFNLSFRSKFLARGIEPGQFLNVQIEDGVDPFLRRPFSYYRVNGDAVEILYEILGHGTGILSRKPEGSRLRVLGPLGKPFKAKIKKNVKRVLVAGGIGIPPLVFLAERYGADCILIGAKSSAEVLPRKEFSRLKCRILYATNDGSYGEKGFVTVLLDEIIRKSKPEELFIQTCGPKPMMQAVMDRAARAGIAGEASIDEGMACGVGACLGCMVETDRGLVPSCTEGPVFGFHQIKQSLVEA